MTEHRVGVNGVVQIDPNEVLGIERDEGVVTGASVLLWPGRWRIALRESSGGGGGGGGAVSSVAGRTGAVVLSSADLTDVDTLATDAELTSGLAGKADATHTHAELHTHANAAALDLVSGTNTGDQDLSGYATTASLATVATTGAYGDLSGKPTIPDTEAIQDVVGAMVAAAGGTYDDAGGSITLPAGGTNPTCYFRGGIAEVSMTANVEVKANINTQFLASEVGMMSGGNCVIPAGQDGVYVIIGVVRLSIGTSGGECHSKIKVNNAEIAYARAMLSAYGDVTAISVWPLSAGATISLHGWASVNCTMAGGGSPFTTLTLWRIA